ncbi:EAL and HDOD domain-containing protein [Demequina pelophila]|uniref:EAL and HDOD domain-containing protein n=1 Tax=Demequina pelophila TaxID=1638984 RepID=UPI0007846F68|nr:EAL domain-containing protein [Demequina pelophila]
MTIAPPRLWHPTACQAAPPHPPRLPALVGRQGIFTADGERAGYELLYRAHLHDTSRVDLWPADAQDRATEHVIAAAFWRSPDITVPHPAFVNVTRGFLMSGAALSHCDPATVVLEVLETVEVDDALLAQVRALRERGFRIAVDDFTGTDSQVALLPLADYVKIDVRDLGADGGAALVALARSGRGGRERLLVAERVERATELERCRDLGFDLYQGFWFERVAIHVQGGYAAS